MMNKVPFNLFHFPNGLPPDTLQDIFRRLRVKSRAEGNPTLRAFLDHTTAVLRDEIRRLSDKVKSQLPPFKDVLDLFELLDWKHGPLAGPLEGVSICLMEIGSFIGYYERNPDSLNLSNKTACFTGIGQGLLSAAAVACCPTLASLPKIGAEAVRLAFRIGVLVDEVSQSIECQETDALAGSWSALVMGLDEDTVQKELDNFNTSTRTPLPSQLYISVGGDGNITVSGPPSKLRQVFRVSETLRSARYELLPVYGGVCHAPHLYNISHAISVMETIDQTTLDRALVDNAPLLSSRDGAPLEASTARQLFQSVIHETLTTTIRWNLAMDAALDIVGESTTKCHVYGFRQCAVTAGMVAAGRNRAPECSFQTWDLMGWIFQDDGSHNALRQEDSKIAIVGMSCRFPGGANDLELFWDLLQEGRDVHQKIPADRYEVDSHTDLSGKTRNTSLSPFGCFIDQPGLFDTGFFGMSPKEAAQTDPMHRLALVTAYEALEQSGFVADRTECTDRRGVSTFYGQSCDDYREANSGQNMGTYCLTGGCRAFAPGRINYFFKFAGPSYDCDTACSASLASIQLACTSLLTGDTQTVVAGGLNVLTNVDGFAGLSRGHFLSKTGGCKTFDRDADGYCRADGIGSIVMKRLEDAQRDNDNILGVILASATNHSADAVSITHPHAPTQEALYRRVMSEAGVNPLDVDYVEMHGTGTQAGDATEMESVTSVFAHPTRKEPLYIGSVKPNIGHGEAAAGVAALIKTLLAFQKGVIPKHVGIKSALNPAFPDLNRLKVQIVYEPVPWERKSSRKRYAVVNNFSAAGGNTTLLLEEPPLPSKPQPGADPRTAFTVTVSAKSKVSLRGNLEKLLGYLQANPSVTLADLSYTTTARRMHHNHRIAVHGKSQAAIVQGLEGYLPTVDTQRPIANSPLSVAFVFSGQSGFYIGIGRQLYEGFPEFQRQIHILDELSVRHGFPSFIGAITGELEAINEPEPIITQLTTVCVSIALCKLWELLGITPSAVVGASLGEFAALYAAGVLSASDVIYLVGNRALLMQNLCTPSTHSMLAVRATEQQIRDVLSECPYEIACLNSRKDITLSGSVEEVANMRLSIEAAGLRCTQLNVPLAFHSAQMDPILSGYERIASGVTYHAPSVPLISPLLAECVFDGQTVNAAYMRNATRNTVQFGTALEAAYDMGVIDENTVWLEIGPHDSYSRFVRGSMPHEALALASLKRNEDNWHTLSRTMTELHTAGAQLNWHAWHAPFESHLRLLELPAYQWNAKNYWIQYEGDWLITKNCKPSESGPACVPSSLRTALVQQVIEETIGDNSGEVFVRSDILQPDFLDAMNAHKINGCAVATASLLTDIAFTLAKYLYSHIRPRSPIPAANVKNMHQERPLIARKDRSQPQWIYIRSRADLSAGSVHLSWYMGDGQGGVAEDSFTSAVVEYGDQNAWLDEWSSTAHLVSSRIDVLQHLADEGTASRLSRDMAYSLLSNLVEYPDKYRGLQSVVLHGMEATARLTFASDPETDKWTVPPYYIHNVAHLAGFILNGGIALGQRRDFYASPGWKSLRFGKPLAPGVKYVSYVRMEPLRDQPGFYIGDVYLLQDGQIVGLVGGVMFRAYPRLLLERFYVPPDTVVQTPGPVRGHTAPAKPVQARTASTAQPLHTPTTTASPATVSTDDPVSVDNDTKLADAVDLAEDNSLASQAVSLIVQETEMDPGEVSTATELASIGIDSLLSLVLAQRFRTELKLEIPNSLFIDCVTIGDLKTWISEYC